MVTVVDWSESYRKWPLEMKRLLMSILHIFRRKREFVSIYSELLKKFRAPSNNKENIKILFPASHVPA
jgi:hypothetical protein